MPLPWKAIGQSKYKSEAVHSGFSFIILIPVKQDCPWHKGNHSSIASLLTLCLSMGLWGEKSLWAVFMWTVIWHLHGTRYEVVSTQECLGIIPDLKVHIFFSMLCKIWKTLGNNLLTCRDRYFISHLLTNGLNWRSGRGHAFNFEESATIQVWELSWRAA